MPRSELIVVSGLPRSGTSMMMAALQAGGVPLLVDDVRQPDASNPRGYFEYQPVRRLGEDKGWLKGQAGRAVKIIYRLLYHIPPELPTKLIFMNRKMEQVLRSQQAMLGTAEDGTEWARLFAAELARVRAWIAGQNNLDLLDVDYAEFLQAPLAGSEAIARFLERPLDVAAMAAIPDFSLQRQRQ